MRLLIFLLVLFTVSPAYAWKARVVRVSDGDTITVIRESDGAKLRIRLAGIDAPETRGRSSHSGVSWDSQPYARRSAAFLRQLLRPDWSYKTGYHTGGPFVDITVVDLWQDKYRRTVGAVVALPTGEVAQEELLRAGLAWVYPQYCKNCAAWEALQEEARRERRGLWADPGPLPPWEWRQGQKTTFSTED